MSGRLPTGHEPRLASMHPEAPSAVRALTRELLEEVVRALFHLLWREVFFPRRDRPVVPLRIDQHAAAIAPELILHLAHRPADDLRACAERAIEQRIRVFGVDPESDRRATQRLRAL